MGKDMLEELSWMRMNMRLATRSNMFTATMKRLTAEVEMHRYIQQMMVPVRCVSSFDQPSLFKYYR